MARLSSDVRYCLASEATPAEAMNRINATFSRSGWQDRFVTFVMAVIDANKQEVTVVNAGHMPPLLHLASGSIEEIGTNEAGLPLGIDDAQEYSQMTHQLAPGDLVVMFTDGISEAMNAQGDLYGLARLREKLAGVEVRDVKFGRTILDDVKQFVGGRAQSDDMCLVCFGRDMN
jgi:serine phosphatase RsbU (regulator of sigma subunit)